MSNDNKLDFIQGVQLVPWEWNNLGALFGQRKDQSQCVAARCNFVVRRGYDEIEHVEYGNVVEGLGDVGFSLRSKEYAFHISASNLTYKTGTDAPLRAQSLVGNALASLKLAYAQELAEDKFLGVSYDFKQRKPELALAWAGDTFTEQASLAVSVDPVDRVMKVRAGVSFPGPDWRYDLYNEETQQVEYIKDDGSSRHTFWVEQELRQRALLASTKAGARIDLGRLANLACEFIDNHIERHIPLLVWKVPLTHYLYKKLVPDQDDDQMRHRIKGWAVELSHDFDRKGPVVGLSKALLKNQEVVVAATYDTASQTAGLELRGKWLQAAARLGRQEDGQWRNPTVQFVIQPLGFL